MKPVKLNVVGPIVLIVVYLLLVVPAGLWVANAEDMALDIRTVLPTLFVWASCGFVLLGLPSLLLSGRWHERYVALLLSFGVALWVQGNLLVWKFGVLNGQAFDFSQGRWRGWVDASLWLAICALGLWNAKWLAQKAGRASAVILAISFATLIVQGVQRDRAAFLMKGLQRPKPVKSAVAVADLADLAAFSSQTNVILLLLDQFQSSQFKILMDRTPLYASQMDGFTFFEDNLGSFPTTYLSYPAILSGRPYSNDVPIRRFVTDTLEGHTLPSVLHDQGFTVDLVALWSHSVHGPYTHAYVIPVPYTTTSAIQRQRIAQLVDLTLFRVSPLWIKPLIYNGQNWLLQRHYDTGNAGLVHTPVSHRNFFNDYQTAMTVSTDKPVFKLIHLAETHAPIVLDKNGRYQGHILPWTQANHLNQAEFMLTQTLAFLNRLKELGTYDKSLIVIHADHGAGWPVPMTGTTSCAASDWSLSPVVGSALALLAVKPIGARAPFSVSTAQTALTDIPKTVIGLLGLPDDFPGRSAFTIPEGEQRNRLFAFYEWRNSNWHSDYLDRFDRYRVEGPALNADSWHLDSGSIATTNNNLDINAVTHVQFGTAETLKRHLVSGWGGNEQLAKEKSTANWGLGSSAKMSLSLPNARLSKLTARIRPWVFDDPQQIEVLVDGETVGKWMPTNAWVWQTCSIEIPAKETRPRVSTVEFRFSQFRTKTTAADPRPLAVMFESLKVR